MCPVYKLLICATLVPLVVVLMSSPKVTRAHVSAQIAAVAAADHLPYSIQLPARTTVAFYFVCAV